MLIERQLTSEEKTEMVQLGTKTHEHVFNYRLHEHEQKCTNEKTPFCRRCSKMSYEKRAAQTMMDMREKGPEPQGTEQTLMNLARDFNFDDYTGKKYFELHSITKVEEPTIINLNKIMRHTANFINLTCAKFKHPYTLRVEIDEYAEWQKNNLTSKDLKNIEVPQQKT